jgi:hypothetical protein
MDLGTAKVAGKCFENEVTPLKIGRSTESYKMVSAGGSRPNRQLHKIKHDVTKPSSSIVNSRFLTDRFLAPKATKDAIERRYLA